MSEPVETLAQADSWAGRHEWDGKHVHEERETPQWVYWVIVGFSLGVMGYLVYEDWKASRKLQAEIDEWAAKVKDRLREGPVLDYKALQEWANREKAKAAKETDETPSAASETV